MADFNFISFPATQVPSADANSLDDYREGSYTGTLTGCATSPTIAVYFTRVGNQVTIDIPSTLSATSNTTACTITGGPATMRPTTAKKVLCRTVDNGVAGVGVCQIGTDGTLTLYKDATEAAFTASGAKGMQINSFSYTLI
jgi:hypothetical protein